MGCYDTIVVKCPECNKRHFLQSKSGICDLSEYNQDAVPLEVAFDANRHGPCTCSCGTVFRVRTEKLPVVLVQLELEVL